MHLSILSNFVFVRTIVQALCTVCIIFFIFLINEANARAQVKQGLIGTNNFRSFINNNTVRNYTQKPGSPFTSLIHNGLLKYVCQKEEYKKEKKKEKKEYDADDEDD